MINVSFFCKFYCVVVEGWQKCCDHLYLGFFTAVEASEKEIVVVAQGGGERGGVERFSCRDTCFGRRTRPRDKAREPRDPLLGRNQGTTEEPSESIGNRDSEKAHGLKRGFPVPGALSFRIALAFLEALTDF